jgi:hypothetical protein
LEVFQREKYNQADDDEIVNWGWDGELKEET